MPSIIDELHAAQEEATEALRSGDPKRQQAAVTRMNEAARQVGLVGGLFILMALEHAGLPIQKKLAQVFNGLARSAWEKASAALARVGFLDSELRAVRERLQTLEERTRAEGQEEADRASEDAVEAVASVGWVQFPHEEE